MQIDSEFPMEISKNLSYLPYTWIYYIILIYVFCTELVTHGNKYAIDDI